MSGRTGLDPIVRRLDTVIMLVTRLATHADAALITRHRHAMFAEIGGAVANTLDEMSRNFTPWLTGMIDANRYVGWIIEEGDAAVASAGFFQLDWPPHPLDPEAGARGYLLNFWVEPGHRGKGLARGLVEEALAESRRRGLRVTTLHASAAGRPVYEACGFSATGEMMFREENP